MASDVGLMCPILQRTIPYGIAYHHSGLTSDERRHLEDAFRQNILCVICCTSTLAAGVNLPAKRVILRSPYVGRDFLTLSRYKQMIGRAGRAGLCGNDVGESILICSAQDNVRVGQLLFSPMDEAASGMHADDSRGLRNLLMSAIGLGVATTRPDLQRLISLTLLNVQAPRLAVNVDQLMDGVLRELFKNKALKTVEDLVGRRSSGSGQTQEIDLSASTAAVELNENGRKRRNVRLKPSTRMEVSQLGRAAFKAGFDLDRARTIYADLVVAQHSIVLVNYLHLLYLVTPFEPKDINVRPDMAIYYAQVNGNYFQSVVVRLQNEIDIILKTFRFVPAFFLFSSRKKGNV